MTREKLAESIERDIRRRGFAKVSAMKVFNLFEPTLNSSYDFTDAVVAFAHGHKWEVYPIGEVPFGELVFSNATRN
jgi:hypothetical protein